MTVSELIEQCDILYTPYYITWFGIVTSFLIAAFQLYGTQTLLVRCCKRRCCPRKMAENRLFKFECNENNEHDEMNFAKYPRYIDIFVIDQSKPECTSISGTYKKMEQFIVNNSSDTCVYKSTHVVLRRYLYIYYHNNLSKWMISFNVPYSNSNDKIVPLASFNINHQKWASSSTVELEAGSVIDIFSQCFVTQPNAKVILHKSDKTGANVDHDNSNNDDGNINIEEVKNNYNEENDQVLDLSNNNIGLNDPHVEISGFDNWGIYHNNILKNNNYQTLVNNILTSVMSNNIGNINDFENIHNAPGSMINVNGTYKSVGIKFIDTVFENSSNQLLKVRISQHAIANSSPQKEGTCIQSVKLYI